MKQINNNYPDVNLTVNYTVTPLSYTELFDLAQYLNANVKLHQFKIQFMDFVSAEIARKHNELVDGIFQEESACDLLDKVDEMDMELLFDMLQRIRNTEFDNINTIKIIPDITSTNDIKQYFSREGKPFKRYTHCYWPFTQIAINTKGNVFWHMRCFNNYILGNINATNLTEIFVKGKRAGYFREKFKASNFLFPACVRCCGAMHHQRKTRKQLFQTIKRKFTRNSS